MKELELHDRENNSDSEDFLKENHERLSAQCIKVYRLLLEGKRLTVPMALSYGIMSLPRRCMDLKQSGADIKDLWLRDEKGKRIMKEWYIELIKRPTKKSVHKFWDEKLKQAELFSD